MKAKAMREVTTMGFLNNVKNAVTGGGGNDIDVSDEFEDIDDEGQDQAPVEDDPLDEPEDDSEPEVMEWDSAYDFAGWYLEEYGFSDMKEFGEKAMMLRLMRSPEYRDRLQNGMETLSTLNSAKQQLDEMKGKDTTGSNYEEMADKIENANRVINGVKTLSGEDEMVVQQGMNLAKEAIGAISQRTANQATQSVESGMSRSDREI